jgi:hypothetical protein
VDGGGEDVAMVEAPEVASRIGLADERIVLRDRSVAVDANDVIRRLSTGPHRPQLWRLVTAGSLSQRLGRWTAQRSGADLTETIHLNFQGVA